MKTKLIIAAISLLIISIFSGSAEALPASCYQYTAPDSFNTPTAWVPWNNSNAGHIVVGVVSGARTGGNAASMSLPPFEAVSSFLLIDRVFNSTNQIDHSLTTRTASRGCSTTIPYNPTGPLLYCSATVWVKPVGGATGFFQFIDDNDNYLATTTFSFDPSTTWQAVSIAPTTDCAADMTVRFGISRNSPNSSSLVADDISIVWDY